MAVRTQIMQGKHLNEAPAGAPPETAHAIATAEVAREVPRAGARPHHARRLFFALALAPLIAGSLGVGLPCFAEPSPSPSRSASAPVVSSGVKVSASDTDRARDAMVREQLEARDIRDQRVLAAMRRVPRDRFVPAERRGQAYEDHPVPIGHGQTISQPYVVALMSELTRLGPNARVLEIGTGSGYQAAILAEMGADVWTIEIVDPLSKEATQTLRSLGYGADRIRIRSGDGYRGWPDAAPFDAILVTAAPPRIPEPLKQQLEVGGRLVLPVGRLFQELIVIERTKDGFTERRVAPVRFVPMIGEVER